DVGFAKNQRDTQTPHRFAESVVTLGEFIMPYRVNQLNDMLWQYRVVADKNLYLCQPLSTLSILGDS
ncbi:MAG: type I-F CRISPR-associated protein Csy2, partial [Methylococcaceae bacterium]